MISNQWLINCSISSRAQSPGVSGSVNSALYRFHTPPLARSPGRFLFSPGSGHNGSFVGNESFYMDPMSSLQPNVCLEQQWSETNQPIRWVGTNQPIRWVGTQAIILSKKQLEIR